MKLKILFGLFFVLLLSSLALAQVDKVVVVNYDSVEDMMVDLNKLKPVQKEITPAESTLKTWTKCTRYYCYEVPVVTIVAPVLTHVHAQAVNKYHYNSHDGVYTNDWDDKEDYYRRYDSYNYYNGHVYSDRYIAMHYLDYHYWD